MPCVNPVRLYGCLNGVTVTGIELVARTDGAYDSEEWKDLAGNVIPNPRSDPNFTLGACSASSTVNVQGIIDAITAQGINIDNTADFAALLAAINALPTNIDTQGIINQLITNDANNVTNLASLLAAINALALIDDTDDDIRAVAPQMYHWDDGTNKGWFTGYLELAEDGSPTEVVVSGTAPPAFTDIVHRGLVVTEFVILDGAAAGAAVPYDETYNGGTVGNTFTLTGPYLSMYAVFAKDTAGDTGVTIGAVDFDINCDQDCVFQDPLFEHVYKEDHYHEGPITFTAKTGAVVHVHIMREVN